MPGQTMLAQSLDVIVLVVLIGWRSVRTPQSLALHASPMPGCALLRCERGGLAREPRVSQPQLPVPESQRTKIPQPQWLCQHRLLSPFHEAPCMRDTET